MEPVTKCSDKQLIALWKEGNAIAFDIFYKRHLNQLVKTALQKTGCIETAKELVQEVFIDIWQHKNDFDLNQNINGYIYTILRNKIFNYYRRKVVEDKYQNHLVNHSPQYSETIDNWLHHKELSQLVASSINQLPERCKMVFMLKREENLSNKEISERLNISANTVEQHMRKALSRLKTSLAHYLSLIVACMFFKL